MIVDGEGKQLALLNRQKGQGIAIADITIGRTKAEKEIPNRYWLHKRGVIPAVAWNYQRLLGKRWYKKYVK